MKITPSKSDLLSWAKRVPTKGDLLFFDKRPTLLIKSIGAHILTTDEVKAQSLSLWSLSARSWYGYALNRANFAVYLPIGSIELMKREVVEDIGHIQIKLEVPSVIESKYLTDVTNRSFIKLGRYHWVTSQAFQSLPNSKTRINVMSSWMRQNEIHSYESLRLSELPVGAKEILRSVRLDKYLNTYAKHSGPNCLAMASAAAGANPALSDQWLHWSPFKSFLKDQGYKTIKTSSPTAGDILVFMKNKTAVHAAFYLGDDLYFEKPGQDFYEPYRVQHFKLWKSDWPETQLLIFRKG